jgi:hypothetical protein
MITFGFQNAEPLRLAGLATPTLSVVTAWCVLGNDRWHGEPGIAPLLHPAAAPQVQPGVVVQGKLETGDQRRLPRAQSQD